MGQWNAAEEINLESDESESSDEDGGGVGLWASPNLRKAGRRVKKKESSEDDSDFRPGERSASSKDTSALI
eukprot:355627-Karenia_brevis.AAC.1